MVAEHDKTIFGTHALHGFTQHAISFTVDPVDGVSRLGISFFMQRMLRIDPTIKHVGDPVRLDKHGDHDIAVVMIQCIVKHIFPFLQRCAHHFQEGVIRQMTFVERPGFLRHANRVVQAKAFFHFSGVVRWRRQRNHRVAGVDVEWGRHRAEHADRHRAGKRGQCLSRMPGQNS